MGDGGLAKEIVSDAVDDNVGPLLLVDCELDAREIRRKVVDAFWPESGATAGARGTSWEKVLLSGMRDFALFYDCILRDDVVV